jgi:LPS-assembly protein
MLRVLILTFAMSLTAIVAQAQSTDTVPAILVADDVSIDQDRVMKAQGNVEAFQGKIRLKAVSISYDPRSGSLSITGPITIQDGDGITIFADQAELSNDLQNGLLLGARMVLDQRLQLASVEMNRADGRYTQLNKTALTSCQVCNDGRQPLWQIRAKRVVHDRIEQQLHFYHAQLRVGNIPVIYIPRLRLPDPTLDRATGFLIPFWQASSKLGTGLKLPYFMKLGDHRDITLTPYLSSKTKTLEFRYRQAFVYGTIRFDGAVSEDDLFPTKSRAYLFGSGQFNLGQDYVLAFDIETTSDNAYLRTYDYTSKDRLDSAISISRSQRDKYVRAEFVKFSSLRENETSATLLSNAFDVDYEKKFFPKLLGGELSIDTNAHGHFRESNVNIDGRDVLRFNLEAEWANQWTLRNGLVAQTKLGVALDTFRIVQDTGFPGNETGISPYGLVTLRYPMIRKSAKITQTIEPFVQLGWTGGANLNVPIEESTRVEFDEGNLVSLSRFPRFDRRERGSNMALGMNWGRYNPTGWSSRLTLGQVLQGDPDSGFTTTSGLVGATSDFVISGQLETPSGLELIGRSIFNERFDVAKAEVRGSLAINKAKIGASYTWLTDDLAEERPIKVSELTFDGFYQISDKWSANANWRYNLVDDRSSKSGLKVTYQNECVSIDLSMNKSNPSSTVEPLTDLGFKVSLLGFSGSNGTRRLKRSCGKQIK